MDVLRTKKDSAKESLKRSKKSLEWAENAVQSANYDLRVHQDKMNEYDDLETAGAILLAIPVFGWIAGPIMISEAQKGMEEALNAIRAAKWEKQSSESQVRNWTEKMYHYQNIISRTQNEIEQTNEALKRIEWETERVQMHLKGTADIQEIVRKAMNLLSVLGGRVTVLERQTQCFILWEPVVKVMQDVMKAVVNITENRLLYSRGVPDFMNALRENVGELLALCNSASNSEYDNYY
ncbi:uncharacterized protein LOC125280857 [Megalobrama amblycephala]|uniref:uncharacterized protein LOC125280857 n=1 Tax=Megalobrama amblycephala TaxID=75352 RepID=UPI0020144B36|nr:uncharacterized protein LOC125280857 [Megalobrama amblycephala]